MKRQEQQSKRAAKQAWDPSTRSGVEATKDELAALAPLSASIDPARPGRVSARLWGAHRSAVRGRGMEFAEVRAYSPGDEVRHMDWRVTARTGAPHSKLFEEERERPLIVLADMRASMRFGTRQCFKSVAAARWAALLVFWAVSRGDRVGGVSLSGFGVRSQRLRRDRRGTAALIAMLADTTTVDCELEPASLADALVEVRRLASHGSEVFVLSDFSDLDGSAARHLNALARHSQASCLLVHDPLECEPPAPGQYRVSNGTQVVALGLGSKRSRASWISPYETRLARLEELCHEGGARLELLSTANDGLGFAPVATGGAA